MIEGPKFYELCICLDEKIQFSTTLTKISLNDDTHCAMILANEVLRNAPPHFGRLGGLFHVSLQTFVFGSRQSRVSL
jgi:hypothetical protein